MLAQPIAFTSPHTPNLDSPVWRTPHKNSLMLPGVAVGGPAVPPKRRGSSTSRREPHKFRFLPWLIRIPMGEDWASLPLKGFSFLFFFFHFDNWPSLETSGKPLRNQTWQKDSQQRLGCGRILRGTLSSCTYCYPQASVGGRWWPTKSSHYQLSLSLFFILDFKLSGASRQDSTFSNCFFFFSGIGLQWTKQ